ncbi:MAG TPA: hypothetical protein VKV19_02510 [Ktedonobacteraceae bacterium]|jgi:hypothetical protein|nr:hypothetical protein [Ktedonobacteraceae bacterium]
MLCPACNNFRPSNNALCPWCNALPPVAGNGWGSQNASPAGNENQAAFANSWGGPALSNNDWSASASQMNFPLPSWQDPTGSGARQLAFSPPEQSPVTQQQQTDNSFWSQALGTSEEGGGQSRDQSLLPVPYREPVNQQSLMALPTGFPTLGSGIQQVRSLAPVLPEAGQEAPVYVPPMYTKPRPIIPRYRAISGLISVFVVVVLLCSGAGYFAQTTGKLTGIEKLLGIYVPSPVASNTHFLPVPTTQVMYNTASPAAKVITSVGLSTSVSQSGQIPFYVNKFTVGSTVYITCGTNTSQAGVVAVWWYTNGNRYHQQSLSVPAKSTPVVEFYLSFGQPGEDKAEVYWNNELAATVLFVVEPAA